MTSAALPKYNSFQLIISTLASGYLKFQWQKPTRGDHFYNTIVGEGDLRRFFTFFSFNSKRLVINIWLMAQIKLGSFAHFSGKTTMFYPNYFLLNY